MNDLSPALAVAVVLLAVAALLLWRVRRRSLFGTPDDQSTFRTLHTVSLAGPSLRAGLHGPQVPKAARHLRTLLGTPAVALTDAERLLAWDGVGNRGHDSSAGSFAAKTLGSGRTEVWGAGDVDCGEADCPIRQVIVAPLTVDGRVVGTLQAYSSDAGAGLVRAATEVARWVSGQLELAELDHSRTRLIEAEVRALRAQISPHFVYNSLTAIASFVRTDPVRARELLLEFADFTRYSFRRHGDFSTLSEELKSIDRYLLLEKARFGDRLRVRLRIAPEVLPVAIPFLSLQPLVENAVRHGLEAKEGSGEVVIQAVDDGGECLISVEDDGVGIDPERVRRALAGDSSSDSVGLGNVDERLRAIFGDGYGLVVETAEGAGMRVSMRVPKYHPGVRAST